jgi:hypothetical protein
VTAAPSFAPITDAVLANLRTRITRVYDSFVPPESPLPYVFVSPLFRTWRPQLSNREARVEAVVQLTCVGWSSVSVEDMEHRARVAMLMPMTIPGWRLWRAETTDSTPGVDRDVTPHRLFSTPTWRLFLHTI